MMKKNDIIIIIIVIVLAIVLYLGNILINSNYDEMTVEVYSRGELIYQNILTEKTNDVLVIDNEYGYNKIIIVDGIVSMHEADCRDQVCVLSKPINRPGESIVCLPNQVIIEIKGISFNEIDVISN